MYGTHEDKIEGALKFIRSTSEKELAAFIVNQTEAIEGLSQNNQSFIEAFRKMTPPI